MLECVVNVSEGRNLDLLAAWRAALGPDCLDVHSDPHHNRAVFTLVGEEAPRLLARLATSECTIDNHEGVHPRLGVVDVVPFVPLHGSTMHDAIAARDRFMAWAVGELGVPVFLYGPMVDGLTRTLPLVRKTAWALLPPDAGPTSPHPTAGAMCVGAREPLVAYNLWLRDADLATAKSVATAVRSEHMRTLGLQVGGLAQVSMNLVAPHIVGPAEAHDAVAQLARVQQAELVGLLPASVLAEIPRTRWNELDVAMERTIEWRLSNRPDPTD
jgi:glutamate formiminotransferase